MSKSFVLLVCVVAVLGIVSTPAAFADTVIAAHESCRADLAQPDTNRHNSKKLSVRANNTGHKSWIKFDLGDLDVGNLEGATLTVALNRPKDGAQYIDISVVNDDFLDNIGWDERSLTWNNAPGNNTSDLGALDTNTTTLLSRVNFTSGAAGDPFTIDVLGVLEADTDGILQFVLHNGRSSLDFATHDHAEEEWRPFLRVIEGPKALARNPFPENGATDVPSEGVVLAWTSGDYVAGLSPMHRVFFGAAFGDVNDGVGGATQNANDTAAPGGALDFGETYYWRVDEANSVSGWDRGEVWRFSVEPVGYPLVGEQIRATASGVDSPLINPNNVTNGAGLDENDQHSRSDTDMWLSGDSEPNEAWIQFAFDRPYKLLQMRVWNHNSHLEGLVGFGIKEALIEYSLDGSDWQSWGITELARASDTPTTEVGFHDVMAQYVRMTALSNWGGIFRQYGLSEVRFMVTPVRPRDLNPAEGDTEVDLAVVLNWRGGREAALHEVSLGTDPNELALVAAVTGSPYGQYDTAAVGLQLGQTYFWQIREVNEAESPTTHLGQVLRFTTVESLGIDDMERYEDAEFKEIWATWADGFTETSNGGLVGNGGSGAPETDIVYGGRQSLPLHYDNRTTSYSETTVQIADLAIGSNWTRLGAQTLALYFHGSLGNTGRLYVKVNGIKQVYEGDPDALAQAIWQPFLVDVTLPSMTPDNVRTLTIGVENAGSSGVVYIDDIRLVGQGG